MGVIRNILSSKEMLLCLIFLLSATIIGHAAGAKEGIIISGGVTGYDGPDIASVEVLDPITGQICSLPSIPDPRIEHTMVSLTICGGGAWYSPNTTETTCITFSFSSGEWVTSHSLVEERYSHSSWVTEEGTILLGGGFSPNTTEIVTQTEFDSSPGFTLQHDFQGACSIVDQTTGTLIVTGGMVGYPYYVVGTVSRYDTLGFVEDLPSMNIERWTHGCGSYLRDDGSQVLLVAGGYSVGWSDDDSTEILPPDSSSWVWAAKLPRRMYGMKGVSLGGVLYMTGGFGFSSNSRDEVYSWTEESWVEVAKLKEPRRQHAASLIVMNEDLMEFCV